MRCCVNWIEIGLYAAYLSLLLLPCRLWCIITHTLRNWLDPSPSIPDPSIPSTRRTIGPYRAWCPLYMAFYRFPTLPPPPLFNPYQILKNGCIKGRTTRQAFHRRAGTRVLLITWIFDTRYHALPSCSTKWSPSSFAGSGRARALCVWRNKKPLPPSPFLPSLCLLYSLMSSSSNNWITSAASRPPFIQSQQQIWAQRPFLVEGTSGLFEFPPLTNYPPWKEGGGGGR